MKQLNRLLKAISVLLLVFIIIPCIIILTIKWIIDGKKSFIRYAEDYFDWLSTN